jgi:hypothetical protein
MNAPLYPRDARKDAQTCTTCKKFSRFRPRRLAAEPKSASGFQLIPPDSRESGMLELHAGRELFLSALFARYPTRLAIMHEVTRRSPGLRMARHLNGPVKIKIG